MEIKKVTNAEYKKDNIFAAFTCKKQIGQGVTSRIYKMVHNKNQKKFALKEISMMDEENIECVMKERMFKNLKHNNLLSYDCLYIGKRPENLNKIIRNDIIEKRPTSATQYVVEEIKNDFVKNEKILNEKNTILLEDKNYISAIISKKIVKIQNDEKYKNLRCPPLCKNYCCEDNECDIENAKTRHRNSESKYFDVKAMYKEKETHVRQKKVSKEMNYGYFITEYCEFSLRDFLDLRNDIYFSSNAHSFLTCSKNKGAMHRSSDDKITHKNNYMKQNCCDQNVKYLQKNNCIVDIENISHDYLKICNARYKYFMQPNSYDEDQTNLRIDLIKDGKEVPKSKKQKYKIQSKSAEQIYCNKKNNQNNQAFNSKVSAYDTFGLKKKIPQCFIKNSFTYDIKINRFFFIAILKEILKGLMFLHAKRIIHNDINHLIFCLVKI